MVAAAQFRIALALGLVDALVIEVASGVVGVSAIAEVSVVAIESAIAVSAAARQVVERLVATAVVIRRVVPVVDHQAWAGEAPGPVEADTVAAVAEDLVVEAVAAEVVAAVAVEAVGGDRRVALRLRGV